MIDLKKAIIPEASSVNDALKAIDASSLRMAIICSKDARLIGIVSDGDIRRHLISNGNLLDSVNTIMNTNPITSSIHISREDRKRLIMNKDLVGIPILDDNKKLIAFQSLNSLIYLKESNATVLIQAGGFGKRLLPLTADCPKPMLKVGDKPILETIISNLRDQGFKKIIISTHFLSDLITDYFKDGTKFGVDINYVYEENPLGTGGVLGHISKEFIHDDLIITNGDILTNMDFNNLLKSHQDSNCKATICSKQFSVYLPYGVIDQETTAFKILEKPTYDYKVNTGIYVLNKSYVLAQTKNIFKNMTDIICEISEKDAINIFEVKDLWIDIGRKEDFDKANKKYHEAF